MIDLTKDEALQMQRLYYANKNAEQALTQFATGIALHYKVDLDEYEIVMDKGQLKPKIEATNGKKK